MTLSIATIQGSVSDYNLYSLLAGELSRRLPGEEGDDLDDFLKRLSKLPIGFQAMAAMYQLDVSMALDDLGCHFNNWHHRGYIKKQIWALQELELIEHASILAEAFKVAQLYWDDIGGYGKLGAFGDWYYDSALDKALGPLNVRMWALCSPNGKFEGMLGQWPQYARKYPERLQDAN
ncbi:MAG: hypothetical protein K2P86_03750 [Xanthobacteraceae bacterium]|nr:hypothetical protein [Xanthobacteraceae bacterium]